MKPVRLAVVVTSVLILTGLSAPGARAADDDPCAAMTTAVAQRSDAADRAALLTTTGVTGSQAAAYPRDLGSPFRVADRATAGLTAVKLLTRNSDLLYLLDHDEVGTAVSRYRYTDRGVVFWASDVALPCTTPVYRFRSGSVHRQAVGAAADALLADGWIREGISFHAVVTAATTPPATVDTRFTLAVEPDTQQEVLGDDGRFRQRNQWLADHAEQLDLRFVGHTGDVVNWDTADHDQYAVARDALRPLEEADIPYQLSVGNHDSQATGVGGSARDPGRTRQLARDTTTFNTYFDAARYGAVTAAFEPGKVDNLYSEFTAGGSRWLVLSLELWPRTAVVDWARGVVADHPDSNVVVLTHSYLEADGSISTAAPYGDTSPQQLYDRLISRYANIRLVFSGHVGVATDRRDVGVHGNVIRSFLTAIHSTTTNPVRLVEIDTAADTLSTRVVAPWDDASTWRGEDATFTGMDWN